jgi:tetratricopeptide (TPR) repeat protein
MARFSFQLKLLRLESLRLASARGTLVSRASSHFLALLLATLSILCSLTAPAARSQEKTGGIVVHVQLEDRSSYDQGAAVNLYTFAGAPVGVATTVGGQAVFGNLPKATYALEVVAPGFERFTQSVEISTNGDQQYVYVMLKPLPGFKASLAQAGPPILAPNAQKELNKALETLRANNLEESKKHLEKASRNAPSNPDVNYLWGMYYAQTSDWGHAQAYWEKAIQVYPHHTFSLAALGQLSVQNGDYPKAIDYLGHAVDAAPSSWRYEQQLAHAYLLHNENDQAQKHAERAIELGKDRANSAQLILAKSLLRQGQPALAQKALNALLAQHPSDSDSQEAAKLLASLTHPAPEIAVAPTPVPAMTAIPEVKKPAPVASSYIRDELLPPAKWMPPDVDESMPAVESGAACPLQKIQDETGKRVRSFVDGVNRISATEALEHEIVDRYGLTTKHETRKFSYVESLQEIKPGMYRVEEYRNGTMGLDVFPERLASLGLGSLVMIFHPAYRDEYEVTCEGASRWHGVQTWQIHFRQRADRPSRLREYSVAKQVFPVALRGRAWIAADTYQVVSLETDMVAPIPQIRLKAEHISIDYTPVKFQKGNEELWLPQNAELFFDLAGRRIHRRHHFSNYLLFSVDEKQKIAEPAMNIESDAAPAAQPKF